MRTPARLGLYAAGLAVVFAAAFVAADAAVPQRTVDHWTKEAKGHTMGDSGDESGTGHGGHGSESAAAAPAVPGLASASGGYLLSPVKAPGDVDADGTLSFRIVDADGEAVTDFVTSHEKKLHLIVVRSDGSQFRHVHPTLAADGTWSLPWRWSEAGTYRVYADFVPAGKEASPLTLTRTVDVAGHLRPTSPTPTRTATVDGFTVELTGAVTAGSTSDLTFTVTRDGKPVETLQPHLGAFGHLVALRQGDLGYLHVHPEGYEPAAGELSGPSIGFKAEAPTPGRYLLYLDFRVGGTVRTAEFVVDTEGSAAGDHEAAPESDAGHGH